MDAYNILVLILGAMLAIFLIISVIAMIALVKILKHVESLVDQAQKVADNALKVGEFFQHTSTPVAFGKLLSNIAGSVFSKKSRK